MRLEIIFAPQLPVLRTHRYLYIHTYTYSNHYWGPRLPAAHPFPQLEGKYFIRDDGILPAIERLEFLRARGLLFPGIPSQADRERLFREFWPFKDDYV